MARYSARITLDEEQRPALDDELTRAEPTDRPTEESPQALAGRFPRDRHLHASREDARPTPTGHPGRQEPTHL